jgi:DNA invertase Pin-like site-specific DNA recombinase
VSDEQIAVIHRMRRDGEKIAAIARATALSRVTVYHYLPKGGAK